MLRYEDDPVFHYMLYEFVTEDDDAEPEDDVEVTFTIELTVEDGSDADELYPTRILDDWYGNSEKIRKGHYLAAKDRHAAAEKARKSRLETVYETPEKVSQIVSQKTEEGSGASRTPRNGIGYMPSKNRISRFREEDRGIQKKDKWAMRDSKNLWKFRRKSDFPRLVGHEVGQCVPTRL